MKLVIESKKKPSLPALDQRSTKYTPLKTESSYQLQNDEFDDNNLATKTDFYGWTRSVNQSPKEAELFKGSPNLYLTMSSKRRESSPQFEKPNPIAFPIKHSNKGLAKDKSFDFFTKMLELEKYFESNSLPPVSATNFKDPTRNFHRENLSLSKAMELIYGLRDSQELPYPASIKGAVEVLERVIYFDYQLLIPLRPQLAQLLTPECKRVLFGETQEKVTCKTLLHLLCFEFVKISEAKIQAISSLQEMLAAKLKEIDSLKQIINDSPEKLIISELETRLEKKDGAIEDLNQTIQSLENSYKKAMEFSERLKGERDEAKDEIVIIQNEVHKLSDYIKSNQDQRKAEILEAERLKNKFNEMEKNFEKSVQCMEDGLVKLEAAKREISYLRTECDKQKLENEKLIAKHLVGADQMTPRPRARDMYEVRRGKNDLPVDFDKLSTEDRFMVLIDKLIEVDKHKSKPQLASVSKPRVLYKQPSGVLTAPDIKKPTIAVNDLSIAPVTLGAIKPNTTLLLDEADPLKSGGKGNIVKSLAIPPFTPKRGLQEDIKDPNQFGTLKRNNSVYGGELEAPDDASKTSLTQL